MSTSGPELSNTPKPIDAQRAATARRQAVLHRIEQAAFFGERVLVVRLARGVIDAVTLPQYRGIEQLVVTVGEFDAAIQEFEALGDRVFPFATNLRQRCLVGRIVADNRRVLRTKLRLNDGGQQGIEQHISGRHIASGNGARRLGVPAGDGGEQREDEGRRADGLMGEHVRETFLPTQGTAPGDFSSNFHEPFPLRHFEAKTCRQEPSRPGLARSGRPPPQRRERPSWRDTHHRSESAIAINMQLHL